jgi:hypothetical protein
VQSAAHWLPSRHLRRARTVYRVVCSHARSAQATIAVLTRAQNHTRRNISVRLAFAFTLATSCLGIGRHLHPSGFHSGLVPKHRPHWPSAPVESQMPAQ